jgi:hypothetical protein
MCTAAIDVTYLEADACERCLLEGCKPAMDHAQSASPRETSGGVWCSNDSPILCTDTLHTTQRQTSQDSPLLSPSQPSIRSPPQRLSSFALLRSEFVQQQESTHAGHHLFREVPFHGSLKERELRVERRVEREQTRQLIHLRVGDCSTNLTATHQGAESSLHMTPRTAHTHAHGWGRVSTQESYSVCVGGCVACVVSERASELAP